ncbi:MAG: class I SAM-dependent methyltransferase [Cytophagales bacterium]|nr:class I SAM-dependent methyltransferase [Cytophagales bacterium]
MNQQIRYYFNTVQECNMCGSAASAHKILGRRLNQSQGKNPTRKLGITTTVVKCTRCGLIYSNPQPIPFDLQDHYGVAPEEYWKEDYFKIDATYFEGEIGRLKELMDFKAGMKSLDIGAGLGKAMLALEKTGFDAYGFEASQQFYDRAIHKMGIRPDKLKSGAIEEMEYPENSFDFISFGAVLEHLYNPSGSIRTAMKWLKPNGLMHIEVPSSNWLIGKIINLYYRMRLTDYVTNLSPMHEPYHLFEFGLKSFQEHAKLNNYDIAFYEYCVCQTGMPKIFDYLLKPIMQHTNQGMQLCIWLRKK